MFKNVIWSQVLISWMLNVLHTISDHLPIQNKHALVRSLEVSPVTETCLQFQKCWLNKVLIMMMLIRIYLCWKLRNTKCLRAETRRWWSGKMRGSLCWVTSIKKMTRSRSPHTGRDWGRDVKGKVKRILYLRLYLFMFPGILFWALSFASLS